MFSTDLVDKEFWVHINPAAGAGPIFFDSSLSLGELNFCLAGFRTLYKSRDFR